MKHILVFFILVILSSSINAQQLYFPPAQSENWATTNPSELSWCSTKIDSLYNYLESTNTKAFIVLINGKIVLEKYFDTFTADSSWYWASAGKSMTAFLIGMAQQESYLDINDSSSIYLGKGWTSAAADKEGLITIRHQLSMTTGLDDTRASKDCTDDTCLHYLADAGTRWSYYNAPYTLLDKVIENASGRTINLYMFQKLNNATGISGLYIKLDYNNVLFSKARSMARFGLLNLNKGNWNGTPILTDTNYFNQMINPSQNLNNGYGYLWWLNGKGSYMIPYLQLQIPGNLSPNAPNDMYAALGKNGQILSIAPSKKLVFVRMGNAPYAGDVPFLLCDTIWQHINQLECDTTSVNELITNNTVSIYPNPTQDFVSITFENKPTNLLVELYTIHGQLVLNENSDKLYLGHLPKGLYLLNIKDKSTIIYREKIIVN
jgi:CubicO group peptidase (beta-lactamase class C family)